MIVFIGCVKSKKNKTTEAEELYDSDFFKKNLNYAKSLNPRKIYILSALYGVLELNDIVSPYEKTLNNMSSIEKKKWADICLNQLKEKKVNFDEPVIFLAGENYRMHLKKEFKNYSEPLKGLGIGKQLSFLKTNTKEKNMDDILATWQRIKKLEVDNEMGGFDTIDWVYRNDCKVLNEFIEGNLPKEDKKPLHPAQLTIDDI